MPVLAMLSPLIRLARTVHVVARAREQDGIHFILFVSVVDSTACLVVYGDEVRV